MEARGKFEKGRCMKGLTDFNVILPETASKEEIQKIEEDIKNVVISSGEQWVNELKKLEEVHKGLKLEETRLQEKSMNISIGKNRETLFSNIFDNKDTKYGISFSADGDMEDGVEETLCIDGKLNYAERQKLKYLGRDMRFLDQQIDIAQNSQDMTALQGVLMQWQNTKANMLGILRTKNVQYKAIPQKDFVKEMNKIEKKKAEKSKSHFTSVRINLVNDRSRGMERTRELRRDND